LAVLWAFWVLWAYLRGEVRYWRSWSHVIFLGIAGLTLCQVLPLGNLAHTLSPVAVARWEEARQVGVDIGRPTLSLAPGASREGLGLALMALVTFFLAANTFTSRRDLTMLALALVTSATVNAIIGLADGWTAGGISTGTLARWASRVRF